MGIGAIGSSAGAAAAAAATTVPRPANLDVDLAKSEAQLSDWTYCASGKTPEGKVKIQQITDRISSIKSQMHKAAQASEDVTKAATQVSARAGLSMLGNRLDTYA